MAITDAERHRLHTKLDEVLGEDDAAVLISHLPPSGWSDVARTRDLEHLEARVAGQVDRLDGRIDRFEEHMDHRFALVDARFSRIDERFNTMDERFNTMEARFDATVERVLREQTHRFLAFSCGIATLSVTVLSAVIGIVAG
jgi:hypothetical protein